ncbi:PREDICTED: galactose-specific lectin nattectin-like isoform X3 [Poecilia mexicana]|uniref:galactose-specific lectin nattectin-like isoform X3 n=1 Tax=Poecilia mexicana TaxID=48701 RepID=UPI00072E72A8|nr:PREDICTED: galactose-specific lectin nattectin-like isoform X3 [Poecilia mexicana]
MKLLAVFLLVSSVVVQASGNPHFDSIQTSITCPSGWTPINSRCFLYVPNDMTWANAEKNCLSKGANLASVHNAYEYHQVQNLIAAAGHGSKKAWIGGTDEEEGTWLWSDGSPMIYTNWCPWQPDNWKNSQHCLQINYSDEKCWDDSWCDFRRPSVCTRTV